MARTAIPMRHQPRIHDGLVETCVWTTAIYLVMLAFIGLYYVVIQHFWGDDFLMTSHQLATNGRSITEGLWKVKYMFIWAWAVTLLATLLSERDIDSPGETFVTGWWISANAGFFEEIMYRWLLFFTSMVSLRFFNYITFGLVKWLYVNWLVPVANWATFGHLEPQLTGHKSWLFGAALVSASVAFRDQHKYLGLFGWVNSWFIAMIMFWLMFNYGLWTAIIAHALYDGIIFTVIAVLGWLDRPDKYVHTW